MTVVTPLCSVLDMTSAGIDMECQDCGHTGTPDGFEIHKYIGAKRKTFLLPRCADRAACAVRSEAEAAALRADIASEVEAAAYELTLCRQAVKDAEKELARNVQYALGEGVGVTQVARAAGLSRERVYQIRDGRR